MCVFALTHTHIPLEYYFYICPHCQLLLTPNSHRLLQLQFLGPIRLLEKWKHVLLYVGPPGPRKTPFFSVSVETLTSPLFHFRWAYIHYNLLKLPLTHAYTHAQTHTPLKDRWGSDPELSSWHFCFQPWNGKTKKSKSVFLGWGWRYHLFFSASYTNKNQT